LTGGGILCVFQTPEEVRWMMDENRLERFAQHWGSSATVKAPYYETVLPFVPLTTDLHNQQSLREIEVNNGLEKGSIASARWIKPASQRKAGQQVAHAILSFKTCMAANSAIRQHLVVKGKEIYPYKETTEALRCMKCSSYRHISRNCKSPHDVCGRCAEHHPTQHCRAGDDQLHCANCKQDGHGAASRDCPVFTAETAKRKGRTMEAQYELFITEDPETW
ncbi:hypothetical protein K435DRAFT_622743, partial [Dendrothele bispora CBS 962.96]